MAHPSLPRQQQSIGSAPHASPEAAARTASKPRGHREQSEMGPESTGTSAREPRPLLARCARGGVQTHVPPQCTPLARCCSFARYRPGPFRCLRLLSRKVGQNRTRASGEKQDSPPHGSRFIALAFSGNKTPNARTPPLTSPGFRSLRIAPEVAAGVLPVRSRGCGRRARVSTQQTRRRAPS